MIRCSPADALGGEIGVVERREQRSPRAPSGTAGLALRSLDRAREHGVPAGGVDGDEPRPEPGDRRDRALDRLGDVVELEIGKESGPRARLRCDRAGGPSLTKSSSPTLSTPTAPRTFSAPARASVRLGSRGRR